MNKLTRIFSNYIGNKVMVDDDIYTLLGVVCFDDITHVITEGGRFSYLEHDIKIVLKSFNNISDADVSCVQIIKNSIRLNGNFLTKEEFIRYFSPKQVAPDFGRFSQKECYIAFDILRKLGYDVGFLDIESLIDTGVGIEEEIEE